MKEVLRSRISFGGLHGFVGQSVYLNGLCDRHCHTFAAGNPSLPSFLLAKMNGQSIESMVTKWSLAHHVSGAGSGI